MKYTPLLIGILLVGVILAGCSPSDDRQVVVTDDGKGTIDDSETTDGNTANQETGNDVNAITIEAERFEYSPSTITVKKGEKVKLVINNEDTTHGISIPELGVTGIDSVEFTPDKAGTFSFRCPTFCGDGHREMTGTLIVTE